MVNYRTGTVSNWIFQPFKTIFKDAAVTNNTTYLRNVISDIRLSNGKKNQKKRKRCGSKKSSIALQQKPVADCSQSCPHSNHIYLLQHLQFLIIAICWW